MLLKRNIYLNHIKKYYDSNLIKVLTGIRRCGKSVLLNQIKDELIKDNMIKDDHIIFINFEDLKFIKLKNFVKLNEYILSLIKDDSKYYIFLDEIQNVDNFEKVLSSLKATKNVSIFVTGSNSKLLSGRLASLLVGRCVEFKILPFSYSEFIEYYKLNDKDLPIKSLSNYLRFGGMPQRFDYQDEEDIKNYLKSIYYGIIEKDICNSKSKINKENFITISKYIISNATKEFSPTNIINYFNKSNNDNNNNINIEKESYLTRLNLYRYLDKLEKACLISRVKRYDVASKRTLKLIEKHYLIDNGFYLSCTQTNNINPSHLLENLVYNELIFRGYDVKIGKTYKGEIDFVAIKNNKKCFIQVCYLLSDERVIEREFSAFKQVKDASPKYVLSLDEIDMSIDGITHINIEDFLLYKVDLYIS